VLKRGNKKPKAQKSQTLFEDLRRRESLRPVVLLYTQNKCKIKSYIKRDKKRRL